MLSPRKSIALLALAVVGAGCAKDATPDPATVAVMPTHAVPPSNNLQSMEANLDKIYDTEMAPTDAKISPDAKVIIDSLTDGKKNVKPLLAKDHQLLVDGIATAKKVLVDLSASTSSKIDPMEHDSYVAFYTAIGEKVTARQAEYQAFLNYEQKQDATTLQAVLDAGRNVRGKDLIYNTVKP